MNKPTPPAQAAQGFVEFRERNRREAEKRMADILAQYPPKNADELAEARSARLAPKKSESAPMADALRGAVIIRKRTNLQPGSKNKGPTIAQIRSQVADPAKTAKPQDVLPAPALEPASARVKNAFSTAGLYPVNEETLPLSQAYTRLIELIEHTQRTEKLVADGKVRAGKKCIAPNAHSGTCGLTVRHEMNTCAFHQKPYVFAALQLSPKDVSYDIDLLQDLKTCLSLTPA